MTPLILVVDDDREIRRLVIDILLGEGYDVHSACDGSAALALIDSGIVPNLVVTDVVMPKMTGPQLLAECRQRGMRMPFIMMSAMARPQVGPETVFVQKPFDIHQLLNHVEDTLLPSPAARVIEKVVRTAAL